MSGSSIVVLSQRTSLATCPCQKHGANPWHSSAHRAVTPINTCRTTSRSSIPHYGQFSICPLLADWNDSLTRPLVPCFPQLCFSPRFSFLFPFDSGTWAGSGGSWGGSCAASTGYASCTDYVQAQGGAFANACESRKLSWIRFRLLMISMNT